MLGVGVHPGLPGVSSHHSPAVGSIVVAPVIRMEEVEGTAEPRRRRRRRLVAEHRSVSFGLRFDQGGLAGEEGKRSRTRLCFSVPLDYP